MKSSTDPSVGAHDFKSDMTCLIDVIILLIYNTCIREMVSVGKLSQTGEYLKMRFIFKLRALKLCAMRDVRTKCAVRMPYANQRHRDAPGSIYL